MNPMLRETIGIFLRCLLAFGGGYLLITGMVSLPVTLAALSFGWSLEHQYHQQQLLMMVEMEAHMSEQTAKSWVASPDILHPSVFTPIEKIPVG